MMFLAQMLHFLLAFAWLQLFVNFTAQAPFEDSTEDPERIIGGKVVPEGKYPFMAKISGKIGKCGATILNEDSLLTAAHCVVGDSSDGSDAEKGSKNVEKALIGRANLEDHEDDPKITYKVKISYIHPSYRRFDQGNDIAVVKLAQKIKFSENKKSTGQVCLPLGTDKAEPDCIAIGWGRTDPDDKKSSSKKLRETDLDLQSSSKCESSLGHDLPKYIICTSGKGSKAICHGDSGGPLLCPIKDDKKGDLYQFGITSFVQSSTCVKGMNYFTSAKHFTKWIREKAEKEAKDEEED